MLQQRLDIKCGTENSIPNVQGSGKEGSLTADHLLMIRFLIDKYVIKGRVRLFACFVNLRKVFDTVTQAILLL